MVFSSAQPFMVACCVFTFLQSTIALPHTHPKRQDAGSYDFIIVGGGTAGLTLAARLTEASDTTVLVLEAGGSPEAVASYQVPGADLQVLGSPIDWAFTTLPQASLNGRQLTYNQGRCLGGSSAINGLAYGRGSSSVYDGWQELGNPGWGWADVLPYFIKSTTFIPQDLENLTGNGYDPAMYSQGPIQVSYPGHSYAYPGGEAFVESMSTIGVYAVDDLNNGTNVGATQEKFTIDSQYHRSSSYESYYMQARNRSNLKVLPHSPVQQIILEQEGGEVTASGVIYLDYARGMTFNATATKEVIMSAGSFQTPQLLMLSGIGPAETLAKVGVELYVDRPGVGQDLQDHTYFSINVQADSSISYDPLYSDYSKLQAAASEFQESEGPLVAPVGISFAFEKIPVETLNQIGAAALAANRSDQAHVEYLYESIFYPSYPTPQYTPQQYNTSYISLTAALVAPQSRGSVSVQSNSNSDPPQIDLQYYTDPTDQALAIYAFRNLRRILDQFASYNFTIGPNNGEVSPGPSVQSDEEILNYIRETAVTVWHASGTCAMLPQEEGGVVDPRLKVYGVKNLRIVDASVFPIIPDHHIQAATYMLAEKASDMIKADHGL